MSNNQLLVKVRTFATIANLGPGYDCAGMALDLFNDHEVYEASDGQDCIFIEGNDVHRIATDDSNLICKTLKNTYETKTLKKFSELKKNFKIFCRMGIPVERGLGSSSAAVVAGLLIADKIFDFNLSQKELLELGLKIESHPDNLAPCISGGLSISYTNKKNKTDFKKIDIKENFKILLAIPNFKVNTNEARKLIPSDFPREDVVANISNFALLINSFISGNFNGASEFINDRLHQPYRKAVYPLSMKLVDELNEKANFAAAIGGSGPTVFAIIPLERLDEALSYVEKNLKTKFADFEFRLTSVSRKGSYCL